jgi:hypothetical protein
MRCWSFSSMNTYYTCPKQYQLTYVKKVIPYQETEATKWGSEVHLALENYIGSGIALEEKFLPFKKWGDKVLSLPGEKFMEQKMALTRNLDPTDFEADNAWCRGIIDVLVVDGKRAACYDWKTGKVRPDSDQLKLFAGYVFQHYPDVEVVKTAYVWLKFDQTTVETYRREDLPAIWEHFIAKAAKLEASYEKDKWIPKPSGLCRGWCGAGSNCEFWSPRR